MNRDDRHIHVEVHRERGKSFKLYGQHDDPLHDVCERESQCKQGALASLQYKTSTEVFIDQLTLIVELAKALNTHALSHEIRAAVQCVVIT